MPGLLAATALSGALLTCAAKAQQMRGAPGSASAVTTLPGLNAEIPFGHGLPHTVPFTFAWDGTFDVGMDTGTPVDDKDYQVPAYFTGDIGKITIDLGEGPVSLDSMIAWMKGMASRDAERPSPGVAPANQ
jgi:arylsulfatase